MERNKKFRKKCNNIVGKQTPYSSTDEKTLFHWYEGKRNDHPKTRPKKREKER